jgi:hypothetical protein
MRVKLLGTRPAPVSIRNLFVRLVRGHGPAITVERREIPYWQERGWTRRGREYEGAYRTRFASFRGRIEEHRSGSIEFFLFNPSAEIKASSHWCCFASRGSGQYVVHMGRRPKDVSSGIITIERRITEAYQK